MEEKKRYSNQQSNSTFQPQTYRQSGFEQVNPGRTEMHSSSNPGNGNKTRNSIHKMQAGDTLWNIAEDKLGNGSRWTELQKKDGSAFTNQEARHLQVGTEVFLPNIELTNGSQPIPALQTQIGDLKTNSSAMALETVTGDDRRVNPFRVNGDQQMPTQFSGAELLKASQTYSEGISHRELPGGDKLAKPLGSTISPTIFYKASQGTAPPFQVDDISDRSSRVLPQDNLNKVAQSVSGRGDHQTLSLTTARNITHRIAAAAKDTVLGKPNPPRPPGPHNEGNNHSNNPEPNDQKRRAIVEEAPNYKVDENQDDQQDSNKNGFYADADADAKDGKAEAFAKFGWKTDGFVPYKVEASVTGRAAKGNLEEGAHAEAKLEYGNNVFGHGGSASVSAGFDLGEGEYAAGASVGLDGGARLGNAKENGNELGATVGLGLGINGALIRGADIDKDGQKEYGAEFGLKVGPGAGLNVRVEPKAIKNRFLESTKSIGDRAREGTPSDRLATSIGNKAAMEALRIRNKAVEGAKSTGNKAVEKAKSTGDKLEHGVRDIARRIINNPPILQQKQIAVQIVNKGTLGAKVVEAAKDAVGNKGYCQLNGINPKIGTMIPE